MPNKELFNQPLVTDFANNDRIPVGQPGIEGGKNMLWSVFKAWVQSLAGAGGIWGSIEGDIEDQTDLMELIPDPQIQSDWNQANTEELDYIKNKPTIPTLSTIDYIFGIALAGLDADIAVKEGAAYCPCPENMTIQSVFVSMTTAPTGANVIYDINAAGSKILSTKITIESGEYSSLDATTQPVISDADIDKGEMFRIDCDQKGATVAGKNPVLIIIYRKR